MARTLPPAFQGIDFGQWRNWPTVQTKTGQVYYQLPNNPAMVYSPYDNQIYDNPSNADKYVAEQEAKKKKEGLSPIEQVGILGLSGAAAYGGKELGSNIANLPEYVGKIPDKIGNLLGLGGSGSEAASAAQGAGDVLGLGQSSGTTALQTPIGANEYAGLGGSTGGSFSLSGIGSSGNAILPVAGAYGVYDLLKGDKRGTGGGIAQGAASGAAIGSYFGAPGAGIGAVIGGILGAFGHKPQTEVEEKRLKKLIDNGVQTFSDGSLREKRGRTQQLADVKKQAGVGDDFTGFTPDGQWVNTKWLKSGNEKDLRAQDIWGYAAFSEALGNDWYNTSEQNREKIASKALDLGAVREHHGTIDLTGKNKQELLDYAHRVIGGQDSEEESVVSKWSASPAQAQGNQAQSNQNVSSSVSSNKATNSDITGQNLKPTAPLPDGQTAYARNGVPVNSIKGVQKKVGVKV